MSSSERNKEMISIMINICTRVVTLVFMIATLSILIFSDDKDIRWSITDIWGVLLIGIVSGAGFGIFYIKKNMSNKLLLLLKAIYFLVINAVLFFVAIKLGWMQRNGLQSLSWKVCLYWFIFLSTPLFTFLILTKLKRLTKNLKAVKKLHRSNKNG